MKGRSLAAMEALILVADLGGPTMFARIGIMRALNRHVIMAASANSGGMSGSSVIRCLIE